MAPNVESFWQEVVEKYQKSNEHYDFLAWNDEMLV